MAEVITKLIEVAEEVANEHARQNTVNNDHDNNNDDFADMELDLTEKSGDLNKKITESESRVPVFSVPEKPSQDVGMKILYIFLGGFIFAFSTAGSALLWKYG